MPQSHCHRCSADFRNSVVLAELWTSSTARPYFLVCLCMYGGPVDARRVPGRISRRIVEKCLAHFHRCPTGLLRWLGRISTVIRPSNGRISVEHPPNSMSRPDTLGVSKEFRPLPFRCPAGTRSGLGDADQVSPGVYIKGGQRCTFILRL